MFREIRRKKNELPIEAAKELLRNNKRAALAVNGDDGYPYVVPINFYYEESENRIYFHGAKEGHKLDAIRACDKVSYCVYDHGYRREGEWALNIRGVIVFGKLRLVEDEEKAKKICTQLCQKFTDDKEYLEKELKYSVPRVQCLELVPEHMSGKLVNES